MRSVARAGERLDLTFSDLLANGQAVGRNEGLVVFCFGPLPGERARVEIESVKPKYAVARMLELLERSADRVEPFCSAFGSCGGCHVQHLSYPAQLRWKRSMLAAALARIGGFDGIEPNVPIGMDDPRAYRNKMALVVDGTAPVPQLGFYRQRSHALVPIEGCPVIVPQLDRYVRELHRLRDDQTVMPLLRDARHLVARASRASGQAVLAVTTPHRSAAATAAAPALEAALPGLAGIANSFDLRGENAILGRETVPAAGSTEVEEIAGGVRYRVSVGSFFQINLAMLERIFAYLAPRMRVGLRVVDLYCGAGTFALFFAARGAEVVGVEENAGAIAEARANAATNGLQARVEFVRGRVERAADAPAIRQALERADVAFLDPPRKGCEPQTLEAIVAAGPRAVWYLSCDPATLARDLKFLAANGYRLRDVQPFDMFAQTGHVETLATLERSIPQPE